MTEQGGGGSGETEAMVNVTKEDEEESSIGMFFKMITKKLTKMSDEQKDRAPVLTS
jgi:hypothetical protein